MNAQPITLTITPCGEVRTLYTEEIDLSTIGRLEIHRASNIEFNNRSQEWEVRTLRSEILFSNSSRSSCVDWERRHLEA